MNCIYFNVVVFYFRAGQLESVKYLIEFGVNIDIGIPEPPLIGALVGSYSNVAIFLIHHGADCDIKDLVCIFYFTFIKCVY